MNTNTHSAITDAGLQARWAILPHFVLRQAGFPFCWLSDLASEQISTLLDAVIAVHEDIARVRHQALIVLRQSTRMPRSKPEDSPELIRIQRQIEAIRHKISNGRTVSAKTVTLLSDSYPEISQIVDAWNTLQARLESIDKQLAHEYAQYLTRVQHLIVQLFDLNDRLRLALLMSNESSFVVFDEWLTRQATRTAEFRSPDRSKIDTLTMYLQRFCAKNETHSHFGPFSPGRVDEAGNTIGWDTDLGLERHVFFTHWGAEAIAEAMSRDPMLLPFVKPRKNPAAVLRTPFLQLIEFDFQPPWHTRLGSEQHISPKQEELLTMCDGVLTIADLSAIWQERYPEDSPRIVIERLRDLERMGVLFLRFEVPVGTAKPLADLQALLSDALPNAHDWLQVIASFEHALRLFVDADLGERQRLFIRVKQQFEQLTGVRAERGHGRLFADRSLLYEECRRDLRELTIGNSLVTAIQHELGTFLDLRLLPTRYRFVSEQNLARAWFCERFGQGRMVPLQEYLAHFCAAPEVIEAGLQRIDTELNCLYHAIDHFFLTESSKAGEHHIDLATIKQFVDSYDCSVPTVCNPDLLIIAESRAAIASGAFRLLVGDCHAVRELLSHTSFSPIISDRTPAFAADVLSHY